MTDPAIIKAAAHQIMMKLQLRDFGHVVDGEFHTSGRQTEEFIKACEEAAADVLIAVTPLIRAQVLEETAGLAETDWWDGAYIAARIRALKEQP